MIRLCTEARGEVMRIKRRPSPGRRDRPVDVQTRGSEPVHRVQPRYQAGGEVRRGLRDELLHGRIRPPLRVVHRREESLHLLHLGPPLTIVRNGLTKRPGLGRFDIERIGAASHWNGVAQVDG